MENTVLLKVEEIVKKQGGVPRVLAYDGCMIEDNLRPTLDALFSEIESEVQTMFPSLVFKMNEKVMNEGFDVPIEWRTKKERKEEEALKKEERRIKKQIQREIDEEDDDEEYALWKVDFEKEFCKIRHTTSIAFKDYSGEWDFRTLNDLQQMYSEKGEMWLKFTKRWWYDATMRVYQYADIFSPTETVPINAFNLWVEYPLSQYRNERVKYYQVCPESDVWFEAYSHKKIEANTYYKYDRLSPRSEFIINHIKILCGNNPECHYYVLDWIGQFLQYPHNKTTALAFASIEGAGKDSLLLFLRKMLGHKKITETSRPEDVFGRFNAKLIDSLLVCLNEMTAQDMSKYDKDMKMLITEEHLNIESKGQKIFTMRSFHRQISFTNQENFPIQTSKNDRRKLVIRCSDEKVGNTEYFNELYSIIADEEILIELFNFFMNRDVELFNKERGRNKPTTEYQQILTENYSNPVEDWLKTVPELSGLKCPSCEYVNDKCSTCLFYKSNEIEWTSTEAIEQFKYYCERTNNKIDLSAKALGVRINILIMNKLVGIDKKHTKYGVKYLINKTELENHFNPPPKPLLPTLV
jgi:hypothetical protein